jgi:tetratricopeptide (TPR) repeat protein
VQCLFCGKGIGPIRQIRDLEFCSDAHRSQFRERYRQQLYEALAPEPGPARLADFMERPSVKGGPAPYAVLRVLPKSLPDAYQPAMRAEAAGACVERPRWVFGQTLAAMPMRLAWHAFTTPHPAPLAAASVSISIQPPETSAAGARPTPLVAANGATRPLFAAPRISEPARSLPNAISLPEAAGTFAPAHAAPASPQLRAVTPLSGDPAAIGPVPSAIHPAAILPRSTAIAGPTAPAGPATASQAGLSPAVMASQPRPLEAASLPAQCAEPLAYTPETRNFGINLPKPPAAAASSRSAVAAQPAPPVSGLPVAAEKAMLPASTANRVPLALPGIEAALPTAQQVESAIKGPLDLAPLAPTADPQPAEAPMATPSWHAARADASRNPLGPLGSHVCPQVVCSAGPIGTLAGLLQPVASLQEAAGNRNLRSAVAVAPAHIRTHAARHDLSAVPAATLGEMGPAPLPLAEPPAPAAPAAATLSWNAAWDAGQAAAKDQPLLPTADVALPRIDCLPPPAGAIQGLGLALKPDGGRAVRSSAVLWTLRVVHMCNPHFRMDPVRAKFNDLVRPERGTHFSRDLEDTGPRKTNLRAFKHANAAPSNEGKWLFIGAAAAALLLAGVLLPRAASKNFSASLPWQGNSIRQWVSKRATRSFADDFRTGLSQWKGVQAKWPKSWSYSTDGFIHPGQLALYRPSVPLSDYRFEFMAQIESKSVDWVVRAHDADNYYALKFTVVQPGPRPLVAMVRYPVIDGNQGSRVLTPLRMMIHANTPYRVTVDVKGNHYRAYIEGQEADFWTEDRLKTGGVGFFSEAGERARVYWVKLESHGDILGRICGLLSGKSSEGATDPATERETQAMDYRHAGPHLANDANGASSPGGAETAATTAQEARISRVLSKAASLHLDGKLDEGARELVRALDGGERHPALYFALGQLQYELQDYGPAAQSYSQAALLQPLHPTAHFNAGVCLGRVERWDEAAAAFRKAISNDPARSEAHLALGACLVQVGLHNEALDAYDRFLAHHPDHDEALFGKAVALQKRDRGSEAVELYKRILNRNPHSEEALGNLVSLSLANQDYEQVRKYAQRLSETQPKSQIALEGLAGAAFAAGDHQAAADYSRRLAELAPAVFENWFNLGVACHKAGDLGNAAEAYARATRVQPDSPQAHLNLGVALQEQGDLKGARAAYQRALEVDPKLPGVHWNLGLVHEQLGDAEAAEKLYAQVPEDSPDSDDAAFRIGHLRLERSDYPGSIQAFQSCLVKRPNWPEARLNLGIAHWRAGDKDAARTCFQELTASGADSKEALRGLAALSLEHRDYDKAFEIYRQLLDAGERSPELLYNAGLICQRRGEPEDAAVLYREALKTDPQFGEALLNLGHALMSLGNEFEARSCWRKAVLAKPELAQRYFEPAAIAS